MAFKVACENCGNTMHKVWDTPSYYQTITDGGIVECKACKARYKSKYKTSFFNGLLGLSSMIFIVLFFIFAEKILFNDSYGGGILATIFKMICFIAVCNILNFIVVFFMPLRRIDTGDEAFWDIKHKD